MKPDEFKKMLDKIDESMELHGAPSNKKEQEKALEEDKLGYIVKTAMERIGYTSGGFDIMKRLVEEQSSHKIKDKGFTDGYGIVKKWQKQKQKGIKNPISEPDGEGFNIMKMVVKHPTPVKK